MVEVGRFLDELKAAGPFRRRAGFAAEELLRVCDRHVRGEPCDRRERGRRGWIGGGYV